MKKLHIGMIIDGLSGGGAERVVVTLAGAMADRGHHVTLVSLRPEQDYLLPDNVEYLLVKDQYSGPLRRQSEILRRARTLNRVLQKRFGDRPFDLALSNLPKTDRIVAATPCLAHAWFCLHGAVASTQLARKSGIKYWMKQRQLVRTYQGRRIVSVSSGLAQDLIELTSAQPACVKVIPNPFDFELIARLAAAPCPLDGEDFVVHMGRFHEIKRHDRLFAAFLQSGYQGKLVLVGSGNAAEQDRLHRLARQMGISDRVHFAGFVSNPFPYLRAAKALVLSSDSEGFGNVLVEALACGTSVISTRCPYGPEEILTGELARGLCDLNENALAETIRSVLDNPPRLHPADLAPYRLDRIVDCYLALTESDESTS
jgi:glycosyltransferase involved in cell wall biosynthesis